LIPKRATGKINSCYVVERERHTLNFILDDGSTVFADFSSSSLQMGSRCQLHRKFFLFGWKFE
jgi:hypothetical protein